MRTFAPPDKNPPVYLKTKLLNHHTGRPQVVRALVDSGNTVATSAAISSRLATQLGIHFQPLSLTCGNSCRRSDGGSERVSQKCTVSPLPHHRGSHGQGTSD